MNAAIICCPAISKVGHRQDQQPATCRTTQWISTRHSKLCVKTRKEMWSNSVSRLAYPSSLDVHLVPVNEQPSVYIYTYTLIYLGRKFAYNKLWLCIVQRRKHTPSQLQNQLIGRAIYSGGHSLAFHRGRRGFDTRSVHVRFFVDKVVLGHVSL